MKDTDCSRCLDFGLTGPCWHFCGKCKMEIDGASYSDYEGGRWVCWRCNIGIKVSRKAEQNKVA